MNRLWYTNSAKDWNSALPLGNGFMGAMCFGGNIIDRFQLNADSLWYGGYRDRINPDAKKNIPEIRRLISEGKKRSGKTRRPFNGGNTGFSKSLRAAVRFVHHSRKRRKNIHVRSQRQLERPYLRNAPL